MLERDNVAPFIFRKGRELDENEPRNMVVEGNFPWHTTKVQIPEDYAALSPRALKFHDTMEFLIPFILFVIIMVITILAGSLGYFAYRLLNSMWLLFLQLL